MLSIRGIQTQRHSLHYSDTFKTEHEMDGVTFQTVVDRRESSMLSSPIEEVLAVRGTSLQSQQKNRAKRKIQLRVLRRCFWRWNAFVREQHLAWEREIMANWQYKFTLLKSGLNAWTKWVAVEKRRRGLRIAAIRFYAHYLYTLSFNALMKNSALARMLRYWAAPRQIRLLCSLQKRMRQRWIRKSRVSALHSLLPLSRAIQKVHWLVWAWKKWRNYCNYRKHMALEERRRQEQLRAAKLAEEAAIERTRVATLELEYERNRRISEQRSEEASAAALIAQEKSKETFIYQQKLLAQHLTEQERTLQAVAESEVESIQIFKRDQQEMTALLEARRLAVENLTNARNSEIEMIAEIQAQGNALQIKYIEDKKQLQKLQAAPQLEEHQRQALTLIDTEIPSNTLAPHIVNDHGAADRDGECFASNIVSENVKTQQDARHEEHGNSSAEISIQRLANDEDEIHDPSTRMDEKSMISDNENENGKPPNFADVEVIPANDAAHARECLPENLPENDLDKSHATPKTNMLPDTAESASDSVGNKNVSQENILHNQMADAFRRHVLLVTTFAWWKACHLQYQSQRQQLNNSISIVQKNSSTLESRTNDFATVHHQFSEHCPENTVGNNTTQQLSMHDHLPISLNRLEKLLKSLSEQSEAAIVNMKPLSSQSLPSQILRPSTSNLAESNSPDQDSDINSIAEDEMFVIHAAEILCKVRCRQRLRHWRAETTRHVKRARDYRLGAAFNEDLHRGVAQRALRHWRLRTSRRRTLKHNIDLGEAHWMTFNARKVVHRLREHAARRIQERTCLQRRPLRAWYRLTQANSLRRSQFRSKLEKFAFNFAAQQSRALIMTCWQQWVEWYNHRLVKRIALQRAVRHYRARLLPPILQQWNSVTQYLRRSRAEALKKWEKYPRMLLQRTLNYWIQWVNQRYVERQRIEQARSWHRVRFLHFFWRQWCVAVMERKQEMWRRNEAMRYRDYLLQQAALRILLRTTAQTQHERSQHSVANAAQITEVCLRRALEYGRIWRHRTLINRWRRSNGQSKESQIIQDKYKGDLPEINPPPMALRQNSERNEKQLDASPELAKDQIIKSNQMISSSQMRSFHLTNTQTIFPPGASDYVGKANRDTELPEAVHSIESQIQTDSRPVPRKPINLFLDQVTKRTAVLSPSELLKSFKITSTEAHQHAECENERKKSINVNITDRVVAKIDENENGGDDDFDAHITNAEIRDEQESISTSSTVPESIPKMIISKPNSLDTNKNSHRLANNDIERKSMMFVESLRFAPGKKDKPNESSQQHSSDSDSDINSIHGDEIEGIQEPGQTLVPIHQSTSPGSPNKPKFHQETLPQSLDNEESYPYVMNNNLDDVVLNSDVSKKLDEADAKSITPEIEIERLAAQLAECQATKHLMKVCAQRAAQISRQLLQCGSVRAIGGVAPDTTEAMDEKQENALLSELATVEADLHKFAAERKSLRERVHSIRLRLMQLLALVNDNG